jgi:predicted transcriptional regulator of viral defense system
MSARGGSRRVDGINHENRARLERLHREMAGAFDVQHASSALGLEPDRTRKLLAYLARRGWLSRVRRGLYVAVPLDTRVPGEWAEDGWIIAERAFSPCYVGGWSACEHWGLTEQVFRTVLVVTAKKVRHRDQVMQGMPYRLTVRSEDKFFGLTPVWRDQVRVSVSDPTRTIVDLLDDPTLGGGVRNVADVLYEYLTSELRDDALLIEYGDHLGNRAVFKRLGFLLENLNIAAPKLTAASAGRRSAGFVALDPSVQTKGRMVRRWGIRANVALGAHGGDW